MSENAFEAVREIALSLPGVVESVSHGMPSFKLKDKLLARFHEDGESLVLEMDVETRELMLQINPQVYSITDHYMKYPYVLVKLRNADPDDLKGHLLAAWRLIAPKRMIRELESGYGSPGGRL
ncbi:MmcQ/YjbR family DNA-binding protein [Paenibacillus mesophilus]|uniref:MmcQ/YjbR family DNA-binding protein n=1 Tax=Paenibacillus mesophilus TaxID=2582849 RepID=UPI00110EF04A|nr:MmcQ/YjbR family DNA-binding protein [Paenibacillus mesophilus]TMV50145.1 MmcQ/YjbR family DNA-binding protein [Paenibacillus mesophilus]